MTEVGLSLVGGEVGERGGDSWLQRGHGTGLGRTQILLELRPALFNRVEVGRVRWQIQQACSGGLDQCAHARHFVRGQIVHHYAVAWPQVRAQHLFQIRQEHVAIGGRFNGHGGHPTGDRHRAQQRQRAPTSSGHGVVQACTAHRAAPAPRHLRGHATFIQENHVRRVDFLAGLAPVRALKTPRFGILLGGME